MIKTTVYLDSDVLLTIDRMAQSEGRSRAEIIRRAIRIYVGTAEHPTKTSLSFNQILRNAVRTGRLS